MIESADMESLIEMAKVADPEDLEVLQQVVMDSGVACWCSEFAAAIPGADIAALQAATIRGGSPWNAIMFGRRVPVADVAALQQVVDSDVRQLCPRCGCRRTGRCGAVPGTDARLIISRGGPANNRQESPAFAR